MDTSTYAVEAEVERTHWWFVGRRRLLSEIIRGLDVAVDARILDIGTSTGTNLRMLRELGFSRFEGLDLSDDAIRWCAAKGLGRVTKGDVCGMPFPDSEFDMVLATDVIEHVDNDILALQEIRRVLKPGGRVLITVPAFQSLWGLQDEVAHHKRRYRKGEILARIDAAGLHCSDGFYFNYLLFLPILAARRVIRLFRIPLQSENELNSPLINAVLSAVFRVDVWSSPRLYPPFGVSFLAVVRRPTR